jgi:hypothetical protein
MVPPWGGKRCPATPAGYSQAAGRPPSPDSWCGLVGKSAPLPPVPDGPALEGSMPLPPLPHRTPPEPCARPLAGTSIADIGKGGVEDGLTFGQDIGQMSDRPVKIVWPVRHGHHISHISSCGWAPGSLVTVSWDNEALLATTTVNPDGTLTVFFTVPSDAEEGPHQVFFSQSCMGGCLSRFATATFTVT